MPDMVETYAGVGDAPWWLGTSPTAKHAEMLAGDSVDLDTLRVAAGLDWTVSKQPAFVTGANARRIPNVVAIQRDSDGSIFGTAKDGYHLFQNADGFAFLQAILSETEAEGLTAGSLFGGAQCWALVKLGGTVYVRGDGSPLDDYLLAAWGHDGKTALTAADVSIRVVCHNTQTAAIRGASAKTTIRHTPGMTTKVEQVRNALDIHAKYRGVLVETLNRMAVTPITIAGLKAFTEVLLPVREGVEPEKAYRTIAEREAIVSLFERSASLVDLKPTNYRAYQALTEYLDHRKDYRATKVGNAFDRRAMSIMDGSAYDLKTRALSLLS